MSRIMARATTASGKGNCVESILMGLVNAELVE